MNIGGQIEGGALRGALRVRGLRGQVLAAAVSALTLTASAQRARAEAVAAPGATEAAAPAAPGAHAAPKGPSLSAGQLAPAFTLPRVNAVEGGPRNFNLVDWVGASPKEPKKGLVVSFFATWCKPCNEELPYLERLHKVAESKGLGIVVIAIDKEKDADKAIAELIARHGITLPVLRDRFNITARRYFVENLPSMYILRGDGVIDTVHIGYSADISVELPKLASRLLGETIEVPGPVAAGGGAALPSSATAPASAGGATAAGGTAGAAPAGQAAMPGGAPGVTKATSVSPKGK